MLKTSRSTILLAAICLISFICSTSISESAASAKTQERTRSVQSEVLVKTNNPEELALFAARNSFSMRLVGGSETAGNLYLLKSVKGKSAKKILQILKRNPAIELAQPNYEYKKLGRATNDRYFPQEWWFFDTAEETGGISASATWSTETKKQSDVVVAVIDSGANLKHNDLKKNISKGKRKGKNFENPKRKPTDDDGHGSFLAGIIAAVSQNKKGLAGASFGNNLKVMPLRFDFTTAEAIEALEYARAKGVRVVNASWGGYGEEGNDPLLKDAIAAYPGIFVTASGNESFDHESGDKAQKMYPCDFDLPNIICAAASDRNGNLTDYSDYGATSIDVAAPGGTDSNPIMSVSGSKQRYVHGEGSSLSAAFVSAEAGLLLSKYPALSTAQVVEIIKNSVDTNASLEGKVSTGGKVNFQKAFNLAASY